MYMYYWYKCFLNIVCIWLFTQYLIHTWILYLTTKLYDEKKNINTYAFYQNSSYTKKITKFKKKLKQKNIFQLYVYVYMQQYSTIHSPVTEFINIRIWTSILLNKNINIPKKIQKISLIYVLQTYTYCVWIHIFIHSCMYVVQVWTLVGIPTIVTQKKWKKNMKKYLYILVSKMQCLSRNNILL